MKTHSRLAICVIALLAMCPESVHGQSVGTPGGTGVVPRIRFAHSAVGIPNQMTIEGLAPTGTSATLVVALSSTPPPLQSFGYGPAVWGPDLNSPLGAVVFPGLVPNGGAGGGSAISRAGRVNVIPAPPPANIAWQRIAA